MSESFKKNTHKPTQEKELNLYLVSILAYLMCDVLYSVFMALWFVEIPQPIQVCCKQMKKKKVKWIVFRKQQLAMKQRNNSTKIWAYELQISRNFPNERKNSNISDLTVPLNSLKCTSSAWHHIHVTAVHTTVQMNCYVSVQTMI